MKRIVASLSAVVPALLLLPAHATISVTSPSFTYTQDFDTLSAVTTTTTVLPVAWTNDSTLPGWSLLTGAGNAAPTYNVADGSSNTGSFYSLGTAGNAERALGGVASGGTYFGSPASGTTAGYIALALTNNSGAALSGFTLGFAGEQWRNGGNTSAQTMSMQYGFGSSFAAVASWVAPGGSFNWASPVVGATAAAVDGNTAGRVSGLGGIVNTNWAAGDTLWLRWVENNDVGNDHGLAIDDIRLSVSAVPEADRAALLLAGLMAIGFVALRRR
jgi:hypothetical protein